MAALADSLPLWIFNPEVDEVPLSKWKASQLTKWEKDGSALKEKYPTKEALTSW